MVTTNIGDSVFFSLSTTEQRLGRDVIRQLGGKLLMATREQRMKLNVCVRHDLVSGAALLQGMSQWYLSSFLPKCSFIYFNVWPIIILGGYQALDMIINFKQEFAS